MKLKKEKNPKNRRLLKAATGLVILLGLVSALIYTSRIIIIGAAYKAKMLCSEVFVAGRKPVEVISDLESHDLKALRLINTAVNENAGTASADFLGIIKRTAYFRGDTGCVSDCGKERPFGSEERTPAPPRFPSPVSHLPQGTEPPPPINPKLAGVLEEAFHDPDPEHPRQTRAVVVMHHGEITAERYAPGFGPDTRFPGWSMTKSVLNALVGILVRDNRLSVDAPAIIPEWRESGDERAAITLNQLLHMTSGLDFTENPGNPLSDVTRMLLSEPDMAAFAIAQKIKTPPGAHWWYTSGSSIVISRIIRNVMGIEEAYRQFPRRALFDPIGMKSAVLETDLRGTFAASSFMYATARDWARFGMLYLYGGVWAGNKILPDNWIEYTKTAAPGDKGKGYGAHFWLEIPDKYNPRHRALPVDSLHAIGHEGQFISIIPSCEAVIVRLGKTRHPEAWDHGAFIGNVLSALEPILTPHRPPKRTP